MAVETELYIELKGTYDVDKVARAVRRILDVPATDVWVYRPGRSIEVTTQRLSEDLDLEVLARTIRDLVEGHYSVHIHRVRADSYGLGTKQ